MVKVKICGITSVDDALAAVEAGADALGLNFVGGPRQISLEQAGEIVRALPPFVAMVALVRFENGRLSDQELAWLDRQPIRYLQVYGEIGYMEIERLSRQGFVSIPVLGVRDASFPEQAAKWLAPDNHRVTGAIVLDTSDPTRGGGTGRTFCWDWVVQARQAGRLTDWPPIILAGGLCPENVAEAIRTVHPFGVDVSSGVEKQGQPGIKDFIRMRMFVRNARQALTER